VKKNKKSDEEALFALSITVGIVLSTQIVKIPEIAVAKTYSAIKNRI